MTTGNAPNQPKLKTLRHVDQLTSTVISGLALQSRPNMRLKSYLTQQQKLDLHERVGSTVIVMVFCLSDSGPEM